MSVNEKADILIVSAAGLQEAAWQLEKASKDGKKNTTPSLLVTIKNEFEKLKKYLELQGKEQ
ncbi:hypothetical protein ISS22_15425 [candidate division KSB1 bacterium]|nr:hypothetical protein [candidate division KSB1 bacterium]